MKHSLLQPSWSKLCNFFPQWLSISGIDLANSVAISFAHCFSLKSKFCLNPTRIPIALDDSAKTSSAWFSAVCWASRPLGLLLPSNKEQVLGEQRPCTKEKKKEIWTVREAAISAVNALIKCWKIIKSSGKQCTTATSLILI